MLKTTVTQHSIGFEWPILGDTDHDARVIVRYRKKDSCLWKRALNLPRIDYSWYYHTQKAKKRSNLFAGSILFLTPGTTYQVWLKLSDPDGGTAQRLVVVQSRDIPVKPKSGRKLHVTVGTGGGQGSLTSPFRGIGAANEAAKPGDVLLLHKGHYRGIERLTASGTQGQRHVLWTTAGDGDVRFDRLVIEGQYIWVEGFVFRRPKDWPNGADSKRRWRISHSALRGGKGSSNIVIARNRFHGYNHAITLHHTSADWTITDNFIIGDKTHPHLGDTAGEGIDLMKTSGHVVAYNRITQTADGVSYPRSNCDIYGNDIFHTSDDGIELDFAKSNVRVWGNRIHDTKAHGLSFQPQKTGPWYFVRNQVLGGIAVFKFRTLHRFIAINNTFVTWRVVVRMAYNMLRSFSRNNLYISAGGRPLWVAGRSQHQRMPRYNALPIWKPRWFTDVDYDGFDWGTAKFPFRWDRGRFRNLKSFRAVTGIEQHGRRVYRHKIFTRFPFGSSNPGRLPVNLTLRAGCRAVDSGAVVPNLADVFTGHRPDLGAHEFGYPRPHYGPRSPSVMKRHRTYWALH